jgi:putative ABC transport system permease protein
MAALWWRRNDSAKDLRDAVRALRRNPVFTAVAVLTLALGIGANTAIFSVVNGVLLRPLPYPAPEQLVAIRNVWEGNDDGAHSISPAEYFDYRDRLSAFEHLGVSALDEFNLTGAGEAERVPGARISDGVFAALGVTPALGRVFSREEDVPRSDVVVLAYGLWQRRFGGAASAIGSRIVVDGEARTIVGVMPEGFRIPDDLSSATPAELFVPLGLDRVSVRIRVSHFLSGVGRLKRGVTPAQGNADVAAVASRFVTEFPNDYPEKMRFAARAVPLLDSVVGDVRPILTVLLGAVGFVLLIACANVAGLLLARTEARRRELAIRTALGAGRGRLVRQLLAESVVLAVSGGSLGVALAVGTTRLLVALRPPNVPRLEAIGVDGRVLLAALIASTVVGLGVGLLPAAQASRADVQSMLREGGRGTAGSRRQTARRALVIGEVAIALVLLVGAGLMTKSFVRLLSVDPGYRVDHVLTVPVSLPAARYQEAGQVIDFFRELTARVSALPGVTTAGAVAGIPLAAERGDLGINIEGRPVPPGATRPRADWQVVTPGYFRAIGMRMLRGRGIESADLATTPGVVVINEAMARRYWPGEDPIGKRFTLGGRAGPGLVTIVGVVADVRQASLAATAEPEMYLAHTQFRFWGSGSILRSLDLVVRTAGEPGALARAVRETVASLDRQLAIGTFRTMEDVRGESVARPRFLMLLFSAFSILAFAIAVIGVYGVVAYGVAQRRRELGIRLALGARPSKLAAMVVRNGAALALVGIVSGLAVALAMTRFLSGFLFGVTPNDPATLALVVVTLGGAALVASWLPARRAARTDPVEVLRAE